MIKFFRKIRYTLMGQNKTGKYFKYAFGEILLIVIGILIALSINNWNIHQKDLAKEQQILIQLKEEYKKNLIQLKEKITMRNQIIQASSKVLNYIDNPTKPSIDSLIYQLSYIVRNPTFNPIKNDLIESGNLHLIQNDSLKQRLSNWTSDVYQVQENELEWQKFRTEFITPSFVKNGLTRNLTNFVFKDGFTPIHALDKTIKATSKVGNSSKVPDLNIILNKIELEGIASMAITWSNIGNIQSLALEKHIVEILRLINSEINK